jgi:hypothetical protein
MRVLLLVEKGGRRRGLCMCTVNCVPEIPVIEYRKLPDIHGIASSGVNIPCLHT